MPLSSDSMAWMPSITPITTHALGYVLTWSSSDIEHIWQNGYRMGFYRGGPILMSALSGIDIALWDLKGETDQAGSTPKYTG